jgi:hypothetical protein
MQMGGVSNPEVDEDRLGFALHDLGLFILTLTCLSRFCHKLGLFELQPEGNYPQNP